jgi:hypothetical protein
MARRYLDPVLLIGTSVSIAAGIVSYFAGQRDIVLSVAVGFEALAITLILDMLLRFEEQRERVGKSGRLVAKIESVSWLPTVFERLADDISAAELSFGDTIIPIAVRQLLDAYGTQLADLARGHLIVDSYDATIKLDLLTQETGLLRTTSLQSNDLQWHLSEVGRGYWRAQKEAIARGWRIERIFIFDEWTDDLDALAREQQVAGVKVKRVAGVGLPISMQIDFTLWNSKYAFRQWVEETGTGMVDRFTVDPSEIEQFENLWRRIDAAAEVLS